MNSVAICLCAGRAPLVKNTRCAGSSRRGIRQTAWCRGSSSGIKLGIARLFPVIAAVYLAGCAADRAAVADRPAEWSVSKGYTTTNKEAPGMMIASAKSADGNAELSVRCSKGFWAVYVRPESQPRFVAGSERADFFTSVDGAAEIAGSGDRAGLNVVVGSAVMARRLGSARALRVRYTPFDSDERASMDFDLRGLPAAEAAMRDVCGSM